MGVEYKEGESSSVQNYIFPLYSTLRDKYVILIQYLDICSPVKRIHVNYKLTQR